MKLSTFVNEKDNKLNYKLQKIINYGYPIKANI